MNKQVDPYQNPATIDGDFVDIIKVAMASPEKLKEKKPTKK